MISDIKINKDELYELIRVAVRDELNEIKDVSNEEQIELDSLHKKIPSNSSINFDDCIEL